MRSGDVQIEAGNGNFWPGGIRLNILLVSLIMRSGSISSEVDLDNSGKLDINQNEGYSF